MDRTLDNQEKEKVRTARHKFFNLLKPRESSNPYLNHPSLIALAYPDTQTDFPESNKRFKNSSMPFSRSSGSGSKIPLIIRFYDPDTPPQHAKDVLGRTLEEILAWEDAQLERSHNYIQMLFPLPEGSMFNWEAPIITREIMEAFRAKSELRNRLRMSFERMLDFYGFMVSVKPEEDEEEEKGEPRIGDNAESAPQSITEEIGTEQMTDSTTLESKQETQSAVQNSTPSGTEIPASEPNVEPSVHASMEQTGDSKDNVQPSTTQVSADTPAQPDTASQSKRASQTASFGYYVVRAPHWRRAFRNWAVRFDHNHLRITRIIRCLRVLGLKTECDAFFEALVRVFERPDIRINQRSMMYWHRAATGPLYIAPDDDRCDWLRNWDEEKGVFLDE